MQAIRAVKVIGLQCLVLQRMFGADRHKRLGRPQRLKPLGPAGLLAPGILLLQHMEQCHNVSQTAVVARQASAIICSTRPGHVSLYRSTRVLFHPQNGEGGKEGCVHHLSKHST